MSDLLPVEAEKQAGTSQRQRLPIGDGRVCDTLKKRLVGNPEAEAKAPLLGPRTIKLQPAPDEAAANNGVKSLEQIKAEKVVTEWKWKNKSHHELYDQMREHDPVVERPSSEAPGPSRTAPRDHYAYIRDIEDEEERKAAILAKYGVKPRPVRQGSVASSESEDDIPDHVLKDDRLYRMYTERMREERGSRSVSPSEERTGGGSGDDSFFTLRNIMSAVRQSRIGQAFQQSKQYFGPSAAAGGSQENLQRPVARGSLPANLRKTFEGGATTDESDAGVFLPGRQSRSLKRSSSCTSVRRLFERKADESPSPAAESRTLQRRRPQSLRKERVSLIEQGASASPAAKRPQFQPGSSQTLKMRRQLENPSGGEGSSRPASFFGAGLQLSKSSSFSKFREAFESGNLDNLSDDDSDDDQRRPTGVQAELEALRHNPRLQRLMMINGPRKPHQPPPVNKSRTTASCAVDLDEETIEEVAKSKSAIKDMFESQACKITFGGTGGGIAKSSTDPGGNFGAKPKVRKATGGSSGQFTERKWVFDTINKYFDVIKEDEEEEGGEENSSSDEYQDAVSNAPSGRGPSSSSTSVDQRSTSNVVKRIETAESDSDDDDDDESDESEDGEGTETNRAPSFGVVRSSSSVQLQSMLKSILSSRNELSIDTFKANLSAHLKKSRESLCSGGTPAAARRDVSLNREPGVRDSEDEDIGAVAVVAGDVNDTEVTYETDKYLRIPL